MIQTDNIIKAINEKFKQEEKKLNDLSDEFLKKLILVIEEFKSQ